MSENAEERWRREHGDTHHAILPFKAVCGEDERGTRTSDNLSSVTCSKCLRAAPTESQADRARLREALEREAMQPAADRSWCRLCRTEVVEEGAAQRPHPHAPTCALATDTPNPLLEELRTLRKTVEENAVGMRADRYKIHETQVFLSKAEAQLSEAEARHAAAVDLLEQGLRCFQHSNLYAFVRDALRKLKP